MSRSLDMRAEVLEMPARAPSEPSGRAREHGCIEKPPPREIVQFRRIDSIASVAMQPVIDGYLFSETTNSLIGASGTCKSFVALDMACSVATQTPWFGQAVKQPGAVFILAGEGLSGIAKRCKAWSIHHGVSLDGAPIYLSTLPPLHDLVNAAAVVDAIQRIADELFFKAGAVEPSLIIIDTVARALAGADENAASDMGRYVEAMDWLKAQFAAAVLGVHHTGHGADTKSRGRGSSALYAGIDGEFLVTSDGGQVWLRSTKEKDWQKPPELCLDRCPVTWTVDGKAESSLVLVPAGRANMSSAEILERMAELRGQGKSIRAAAKILGISDSAAGRYAQALQYDEKSHGR